MQVSQARALVKELEAELAAHEEHLASLPNQQGLHLERDRDVANIEREHLDDMVVYTRSQLESARQLADQWASIAEEQSTAAEEITQLFDYGWRRLLANSMECRARRLDRERRRRRKRAARWPSSCSSP